MTSDERCRQCGKKRGTCPPGTKWPDGELCGFRDPLAPDEQIAMLREALEQCLIDDDHGEGLERSTRVAARQALDATAQHEANKEASDE